MTDPARRVATPWLAPGCTSVYAQYTIEVAEPRQGRGGHEGAGHSDGRALSRAAAPAAGVRRVSGWAPGSFPVSEAAGRRVISLPMHPYLTEEQQATGRAGAARIGWSRNP